MDDARMRIGGLLVAEHAGLECRKMADNEQDVQPDRMSRRLSRRGTEQKATPQLTTNCSEHGRPMTWWDAESSDRVPR
jgi:hypothetical protein